MKYNSITSAVFLDRPNRFIAHVLLNDAVETVHVKNTGRCRELLVPGATVYLNRAANPGRKTRFDLVAVEKQRPNQAPLLINMDSQAPNRVFGEYAREGRLISSPTLVRPETVYGNSRFDYYLEAENCKAFVEVKGCTLENDGLCLFPDAPTTRGTKHLQELKNCVRDGYRAYLCIVVQMEGMREFRPNRATDPAFAAALESAAASGVILQALTCSVTPDSMTISGEIPIVL